MFRFPQYSHKWKITVLRALTGSKKIVPHDGDEEKKCINNFCLEFLMMQLKQDPIFSKS